MGAVLEGVAANSLDAGGEVDEAQTIHAGEALRANGGHRSGNRQRVDVAATVEGEATHTRNAGGNSHRCQVVAAVEEAFRYCRHAGRQLDIAQRAAIVEHIGAQAYTVGQYDRVEGRAAVEGIVAYGLHVAGYHQARRGWCSF